jgi:hypothetical protein
MQLNYVALWTALAALAAVDALACRALGLHFTNWLPFVAAAGAIGAVALIYGLSGRDSRIAGMAQGVLLSMLFSLLGAILTYAAAVQAGPLYDNQLAAADAALGFDWAAWYGFVSAHPPLQWLLALAYMSLLPQILLSVFWFALTEREHRTIELLANFTLAILLTAVLFHLVPALGPCAGVPRFREAYVDQLALLRRGAWPALDLMHLKGVVAFPSFHTVLAVLFAYAHRGTRLFLPLALLNGLMLVSIPSEGGHYLVDAIAGVAIAAIAILGTRALGALPRPIWARYPAGSSGRFRPESETP